MADSSRTIMTDAGFALETRVRADETKMQFTRATISTDDHFSDTDDALAKLTELSNIQQDGKVTAVQVINTTTVYVQVDVNQAESKADYQMRSAALYAKDDDGTEVLYGVTVLQDPVFVHKDADGSYLGFGINTTVGKASNVVVVVDPANMVTQQVFEGTMKNYYTKAEVDAKFVTDDDFASKLPKNIATTDAANTFAKSQTLAGGATDGKGNAYATTKDVATGLNNGLNAKVTDNKDGTEQLNGVQVQPFNKLSDTIGGRNLLIGTATPASLTGDGLTYQQANTYALAGGMNAYNLFQKYGSTFTLSYDWSVTDTANAYAGTTQQQFSEVPWNSGNIGYIVNLSSSNTSGHVIKTFSLENDSANIATGFQFRQDNVPTTSTVTVSNMKLEKGSVATDWTPAPEDKVNVADMRKPASDVAGIEEVNAKQDKLDYTPANAANVVDRNPDTGVVSTPTDFTKLTVNGGKSVATSDDLKSLEASAWRPLTLKNSSSGIILFKDNGNGTASLTGSANFTVAKGTKTLTPAITPPTGYIFTSLNWNERSYNNNGVWANKYMGSGSSGVLDSFDTIILNGVICFLGQDDNDKPITFSPSELTTVNNSTDCNPALVSISKV